MNGLVDQPEAGAVGLDRQGHPREGAEGLERGAYVARYPASDIVRRSRLTSLRHDLHRAHGISYVRNVPRLVEAADPENARAADPLERRDLACKVVHRVAPLPRAGRAVDPVAEHRDLEAAEVLIAEEVRRRLARSVRAGGLERGVFRSGYLLGVSVLGAATGKGEAGRRAVATDGFEQVQGAEDVRLHGRFGVVERRDHERETREVVDHVRMNVPGRPDHRPGIADVEGSGLDGGVPSFDGVRRLR